MADIPEVVSILQRWSIDTIMSRLARSSPDGWDDIVEETGVKHTTLSGNPLSSAGDLDRLPNETLLRVIEELVFDLPSLCSLWAVSLRTKELVESIPMAGDLFKHASQTLVVLKKTNLTRNLNVEDLYSTLQSENCASCHQSGAFLFLPTCERACLNCLHRARRFRVMPADDAQAIYRVPQKRMKMVPTMLPMHVRKASGRRKKVVSVELVRRIGLLCEDWRGIDSRVLRRDELDAKDREFLWRVELGDASIKQKELVAPSSVYYVGASMRFPHMHPDRTVDPEYWCEGCRFMNKKLNAVSKPHHELIIDDMRWREWKSWSKRELLKHVAKCRGVQEFLRQQHFTR